MLLKRIRTWYRHWYIWFSCLKNFIALKAEYDKLDINKIANVPTTLNSLKTKVDDLHVGKLKTVPVT